jgi:hypothetical protein
MSRSRSKRSAPKYQRAKLCALPFLLAVLGYVLVDQTSSDEDEAVPAAVAAPGLAVSAPQSRPASPAAETLAGRKDKLPTWSELASAHTAELNPFMPIAKEEQLMAAPPSLADHPPAPAPQLAENVVAEKAPAAEPAAPAVDVATLSQQPVRYFFQTNNRRVMLVGERLLSEGQTINRYTVTHLEPNRIELEPADNKP